MCYYYPMKSGARGVWQINRKRSLALAIQEQAIRMQPNPPLCSPNLFGRSLDRSFEPPAPIDPQVSGVGEDAIFVRNNDHIVLKYYKEIADFFAVSDFAGTALITVD